MLAREEVSWRGLLTLVPTLLSEVPGAEEEVWALVRQLVCQGAGGEGGLAAGLLLARQAAGPFSPRFPSYSSWFSLAFQEEATSLAGTSPRELVATLTLILPQEPASVLQVSHTFLTKLLLKGNKGQQLNFTSTRGYGLLRGPTSSSCGGLRPRLRLFLLLGQKKKRAYYAVMAHFKPFWVFSRNLGNF